MDMPSALFVWEYKEQTGICRKSKGGTQKWEINMFTSLNQLTLDMGQMFGN
jgi:hypothetical protein